MSSPDPISNLQLKNLVGFEEGRIHATFSDNSSLIIQNNNNYLTYFFANGEKIRTELKTVPNRDEIKNKVYDALKKNNLFNLKTFLNLTELYSEEDRTVMVNKITFCSWPLASESVESQISVSHDGSILFKATDNLSQLRLLNNGMVFEVDYLQILPNKKPMWVNKVLYEDKYEGSYSFTRDFLTSIDNNQPMNKEKHTLKMGYEYIRIKKKYSIFNFPPQWSYPLLMTFEKYESLLNKNGNSVRYRPVFHPQFLEWLGSLQADPDSTKNECTGLGILKASDDTLLNEIPIVPPSEDDTNVKKADLWRDDNISPLSDLYLKDQVPHHQLSQNFIIWLTNTGEVLIWVQDDDSVVISSQDGKFFTHFHRNVRIPQGKEDVIDSYELKFSVESIPPLTRSKKRPGAQYIFVDIARDANKMVNKSKWAMETNEPRVLNVQPYSEKKIEVPKKLDIDYSKMPFEVIHQAKNGYGIFEAYKSKSIKVVFMDRTVLRINFHQEFANIITKTGDRVTVLLDRPNDFAYYVNIAVEYFENVFTDPETKLARLNETLALEEMVQHTLKKNEVFLALTTKNIPKMDTSIQEMNHSQHLSTIEPGNVSVRSTYMETSQVQDYFDIDEMNYRVQMQLKHNEEMLETLKKSTQLTINK